MSTLTAVPGYEVHDVIGRGGAAVVYLATEVALGRSAALKELAPIQAADPAFAKRFVDEARLAGGLSHPNVVTVYGYFEHEGIPYIAMEYLPCGSLRAACGLSFTQVAGVLDGVLAGLAHAESHGVVHRDLKPENLLISADGRVKIADFGIAKAYNAAVTRAAVTATGTTVGTPAYMAPEQALGQPVGPWTDLYSLGVITWELLVGRAPFEETDTPVAVLYRHVHETVPDVRSLNPEVNPAVATWLATMLAKEPTERFPSATSAAEELEEIVLRLLGPRWRREARLDSEQLGGADHTAMPTPDAAARLLRTPTPQRITPPSHDAPSTASAVVGRDGAEAALAGATIAPRVRAPVYSTVHRILRRHDSDEPEETAAGASRRGLVIGGLLLTVVAAVALALTLGQGGRARRASAAKPLASPSLVVQRRSEAAAGVAAVLQSVLTAREREIAKMDAARTPRAQSGDALGIERAYASGADQIGSLRVPESLVPNINDLDTKLALVAGSYGALADAAGRGDRGAYQHGLATIAKNEQELQADVSAVRALLSPSLSSRSNANAAAGFTGSRLPRMVVPVAHARHVRRANLPSSPARGGSTTTSAEAPVHQSPAPVHESPAPVHESPAPAHEPARSPKPSTEEAKPLH